MLHWRTYRRLESAPCPVLQWDPARYELTDVALPKERVDVGSYDTAEAVQTGARFERGEKIPEELLRTDVVLTRTGAEKRIARATKPTPFLNAPFLGSLNVVIDPLRRQDRTNQWRVFEPEVLQDGVFRIPPGLDGQLLFRVEGSRQSVVYDYHEITGVIYAEIPNPNDITAPGTPLIGDSDIVIAVRVEGTYTKHLRNQKEVITHPKTGAIRGIAVREPDRAYDIRRLCRPSSEGQYAAVDYGQFDGAPVADQFFWEIITDASAERVEQAARRTFPVGTVYRIKDHQDNT